VRVRRDNPEFKDGKPQGKYISAYGDRRHMYFAPDAWNQLDDPEAAIVLVEAEKSVLALTAWADRMHQKIVPVAMGGCYGWLGRNGIKTTSYGERVEERGPLADLDYCNGRRVYVLLDANADTNRAVKAAQVSWCAS